MLGAALTALCCVGLATAHGGVATSVGTPQAVRGASAAAGELTPSPAAGVAALAEVEQTTTVAPTTPPPPVTHPRLTTTKPPAPPPPPVTKAPVRTLPPLPTFPKHHNPCFPWGIC